MIQGGKMLLFRADHALIHQKFYRVRLFTNTRLAKTYGHFSTAAMTMYHGLFRKSQNGNP